MTAPAASTAQRPDPSANAPASVGGDFSCLNNQLTSLEHAPQQVQNLKSDFGDFGDVSFVPAELRISPETKNRLEQERIAAADKDTHAATVLQENIRVQKPLSFRKPTIPV